MAVICDDHAHFHNIPIQTISLKWSLYPLILYSGRDKHNRKGNP